MKINLVIILFIIFQPILSNFCKFISQSCLPFGFIVQPLAEQTQAEYNAQSSELPLVDYQDEGPFRCYRCKAYVNPNMTFQDGGSKAQCNLCLFINDVPVNYQSQLNEFNQRRDRLQRPELCYGAYEFKAPASYLSRPVLDPLFVFVIDVSQFSHPLGFFQQIVQSIKMTLDYMQNPEKTHICFITYDVNIHFYNLAQDPNGEPNVLQLGEITDPFIPYPKEKLILRLVEDRERIDIFLDKLIVMHNVENKKNQAPYVCTGAAISAAKQLISEDGKYYVNNFIFFNDQKCKFNFDNPHLEHKTKRQKKLEELETKYKDKPKIAFHTLTDEGNLKFMQIKRDMIWTTLGWSFIGNFAGILAVGYIEKNSDRWKNLKHVRRREGMKVIVFIGSVLAFTYYGYGRARQEFVREKLKIVEQYSTSSTSK